MQNQSSMNNSSIRFQYNPALTDTVGFFDYCIPLTNTGDKHIADSLQPFYSNLLFDYVKPEKAVAHKEIVTSVFKPHQLQIKSLSSKPMHTQSTDWVIGILLISLIFFAWIQTTYSKRLRQIIKAALQPYFLNQLEREGNLFTERISIGLGVIYYSMTSILLFLVFKKFGFIPSGLSDWQVTLLLFGGLFVFDGIKSVLITISGKVFQTEESSHEIKLNILIFNHLIGVFLFPVSIIALFWNGKFILITGLVIFSLLMIYRFIRLLIIGISTSKYNLLYLILYLCTLEILPILLLLRTIKVL